MNSIGSAEHPREKGEEKKVKESIERSRVCGERIIQESFRSLKENGKIVGDAVKISLEDAECIAHGMNDYIEFMDNLESKMKEWHIQNKDKTSDWVLEEVTHDDLEKGTSAEISPPKEEKSVTTITEPKEKYEATENTLRTEVKALEILLEEKKRQYQLIDERMRELELQRFIASRASEEEKSAGQAEPNVVFRRLLAFQRLSQDAAAEPANERLVSIHQINGCAGKSLFNIHHMYVHGYERPSVSAPTPSKPQYCLHWPELLLLDPLNREMSLHQHRLNSVEHNERLPRIVLCVAQLASSTHNSEPPEKLLLTIPKDQKMIFLLHKKWNALMDSISAKPDGTINKFQYSCSSAFYDALIRFTETRSAGVSNLRAEIVDVSIQTKEGSVHDESLNIAYKEYEDVYWLEFPFMQDLYKTLCSSADEGERCVVKQFNLLHLLLSHMQD